MKKIIINQCYGGFGFSKPFLKTFVQLKPSIKKNNPDIEEFPYLSDSYRRDPIAIQLLEERGTEWSSDQYAKLVVKEVPEDIFKYIQVGEYDGYESLVIHWKKICKEMVWMKSYSKRKALYRSIQEYLKSDKFK